MCMCILRLYPPINTRVFNTNPPGCLSPTPQLLDSRSPCTPRVSTSFRSHPCSVEFTHRCAGFPAASCLLRECLSLPNSPLPFLSTLPTLSHGPPAQAASPSRAPALPSTCSHMKTSSSGFSEGEASAIGGSSTSRSTGKRLKARYTGCVPFQFDRGNLLAQREAWPRCAPPLLSPPPFHHCPLTRWIRHRRPSSSTRRNTISGEGELFSYNSAWGITVDTKHDDASCGLAAAYRVAIGVSADGSWSQIFFHLGPVVGCVVVDPCRLAHLHLIGLPWLPQSFLAEALSRPTRLELPRCEYELAYLPKTPP